MHRMLSYRIVSIFFIIGTLSTSLVWFNSGRANPETALSISPPSIVDLTLGPGSFFQVNVTVQEVQQLWGYQLVLFYDTEVLTATSYGLYSPLQNSFPSGIDDIEGNVGMGAYTYYGDREGWTVVGPEPVCWIEFIVDSIGASNLDLDTTSVGGLVTVAAEVIPHVDIDGFFSNGGELKFRPVVSFTASAQTASVGSSISFDPSSSYDPDGTIVLYDWDFDGDGDSDYSSTTPEVVSHTYTSPSIYPVTLTATDNDGYIARARGGVHITQSPLVSFTKSADTAPIDTPVSFDPGASHDQDGYIVLYEWDFDGDGTYDYTSTIPEVVSHTYTTPDTYRVTLTATDNDGLTGTATATVLMTPEILSIWSSDDAGNSKDSFLLPETVYVTVPSTGQQVTLYVVVEKTSWNNGDPLIDVSDGAETVLLDASPGTQTIRVWAPLLVPGNYDIVMDVNNNGVFDNGVDFVDSMSVRRFFVVPEMPFGAAMALTGMLAALAVFMRKKRSR